MIAKSSYNLRIFIAYEGEMMEATFKDEEVKSVYYRIFAEVDGKVIGRAYLYVIENENRDGAKYGILGEVLVEKEARGGGLGTQLVGQVIEKAKEIGCYKLLADSRFEREKVHSFYERFGFIKHGFEFRLNLLEVEPQE